MKYVRRFVRGIIAASILSFSLVRPLIAQQEVSPDHFDSAAVQNAHVLSGSKGWATHSAVHRTAKRRANKVHRAGRHTASSKKVAG
jgi:hypothetical protein